MVQKDISHIVGKDSSGNDVYRIKGCYHYCIEPEKGSIYIHDESKEFIETSLKCVKNATVYATGEELHNIIIDMNHLYIGGNKFVKYIPCTSEITTINNHEYQIKVGNKKDFDKSILEDKDVQNLLSIVDEKRRDEILSCLTESEGETLLFIKCRERMGIATILENDMNINIIESENITKEEDAIASQDIYKDFEFIAKRGRPEIDESSIINIYKEDAYYYLRKMEERL